MIEKEEVGGHFFSSLGVGVGFFFSISRREVR